MNKRNSLGTFFEQSTVRPLDARFFGPENVCSSKFVQLELLNQDDGKIFKQPCILRFSLHKFSYLKFCFGSNKKLCICSLKPCSWRPYCIAIKLEYLLLFTVAKWSRNKKDLNEVTAAPFSVSFFQLPAARNPPKMREL